MYPAGFTQGQRAKKRAKVPVIKRPRLAILLTSCWILLGATSFLAQEVVTGKDGRRIILKPEGTWVYLKEESRAGGQPTSAVSSHMANPPLISAPAPIEANKQAKVANPVAEAHTSLLRSLRTVVRDPAILQLFTLILTFLTVVGVSVYTYFTYKLLSTQTHQAFENTFFQLLRFHHEIVNAIQKRFGPVNTAPVTGRSVFPTLYNEFVSQYTAKYSENPQAPVDRLAAEAYDSFYEPNQHRLGHYFRNLYHLIKFVDGSRLRPSEKIFYAHLVRAQLSTDEHLLLFYNSLRFKKFYRLIVKYSLLENMPQDKLASRRLKHPGDDKSLYPPSAYGES